MDSLLPNSKTDSFPLVTIAVITRDRDESLKRTLASFSELDYPNLEVIVVDNASTDNTKIIIKQFGYQYIFSPKEFGFARTRQLAVEAAKGEFICWCDDDCVPDSDWVLILIRRFQEDERIALIGGGITNHGFAESMRNKGKEKLAKNATLKICDDFEEPEFFANLNMAARIDSLKTIGGYDLFFKGGYEEVDLVLSLRKNEYKIIFEPQAHVNHFHNSSSYKKGRLIYGASLMRLYLYFKHIDLVGNKGFVKNEAQLFFRDLILAIRLFLSGIKRLSFIRIKRGTIEISNAFISRLSIPIFIYRFRKVIAK
ncbi:glycosyltransferase family 2 protein [Belliella sp. R4-6]|uniref:Glycosyltransferase family 2 protein n=1 Tax=Belliella alkalica TaxID=1730871 RepID=A0ABS9V8W1_9BACT|nr:glycosyltransferase family 2 protein [Belliella alkalica]MCH7412390.1 glycosyltransferase family 2 protein [Belliella alkalica]